MKSMRFLLVTHVCTLSIEFVIVHSFSAYLGPGVRQDTNGPVALSSSIPVLDTTHYKG